MHLNCRVCRLLINLFDRYSVGNATGNVFLNILRQRMNTRLIVTQSSGQEPSPFDHFEYKDSGKTWLTVLKEEIRSHSSSADFGIVEDALRLYRYEPNLVDFVRFIRDAFCHIGEKHCLVRRFSSTTGKIFLSDKNLLEFLENVFQTTISAIEDAYGALAVTAAAVPVFESGVPLSDLVKDY